MKRPGRPPLDENDTSTRVGVSLPSRQYDELCKLALRQDASVPEIIRRLLNGGYPEKKSIK